MLPLHLQLRHPTFRLLALLGKVDAATRASQRLGEQKVLIAIVALEVGLALLVRALDLPQLGFDSRQTVARLARAAALLHEALLELQTDGVLGRPVDRRCALQRRLLRAGSAVGRRLHRRRLVLRRGGLTVDRLVGYGRPLGLRIAPRPPALRHGRQRTNSKHRGGRNGSAEGMPPDTCFTYSQFVLPSCIAGGVDRPAEPLRQTGCGATMDTSS